MFNGLVHYDASFFTSLARMVNEETVQPRDLAMMGMLLPLGIEKGKEFKPDAATVTQLNSAAAEAHAWLMDRATKDGTCLLYTSSIRVGHWRRIGQPGDPQGALRRLDWNAAPEHQQQPQERLTFWASHAVALHGSWQCEV